MKVFTGKEIRPHPDRPLYARPSLRVRLWERWLCFLGFHHWSVPGNLSGSLSYIYCTRGDTRTWTCRADRVCRLK